MSAVEIWNRWNLDEAIHRLISLTPESTTCDIQTYSNALDVIRETDMFSKEPETVRLEPKIREIYPILNDLQREISSLSHYKMESMAANLVGSGTPQIQSNSRESNYGLNSTSIFRPFIGDVSMFSCPQELKLDATPVNRRQVESCQRFGPLGPFEGLDGAGDLFLASQSRQGRKYGNRDYIQVETPVMIDNRGSRETLVSSFPFEKRLGRFGDDDLCNGFDCKLDFCSPIRSVLEGSGDGGWGRFSTPMRS